MQDNTVARLQMQDNTVAGLQMQDNTVAGLQMQDNTVARLQSTRVQTPLPPSIKCDVLRESFCGQSKYSLRNSKENGVLGNLYISLSSTYYRQHKNHLQNQKNKTEKTTCTALARTFLVSSGCTIPSQMALAAVQAALHAANSNSLADFFRGLALSPCEGFSGMASHVGSVCRILNKKA
jgi:hypothetical protein